MKQLRVGIQLYSLREEMEKDMDATLKKVSEMGYDCVEFAGFFDHSAEQVLELLQKYGLQAPSIHQSLEPYLGQDCDAFITFIKKLGVRYSVIPWEDKATYQDPDRYQAFLDNVRTVGAKLAQHGIQLCYHNHDFELEKIDGKYILDRLYEDVEEPLLFTELDLCWIKYGGEDPVAYLNKYAKRSKIVHFKDFYAKTMAAGPAYALIDAKGKEIKTDNDTSDNGFHFCPLGQGVQDFAPMVEAVRASDIEYVVYEMDDWYDADPFELARISRTYLKDTFGI